MLIAANRQEYERQIRTAFARLDADQRRGLRDALTVLVDMALANADESRRRNKHMMYAYWRCVAVYAKSFSRALR
jgi:hypothetical protein